MEDYEQKYKEALERAKDLHDNHPYGEPPVWTTCEKIFPELKESEDGRIRDFLIGFIKVCRWAEKEDQGWPSKEECIAWLEKQDEQKPAWSEDDKRTYSEILDFFLGDIGTRCATIDKQRHFGYWLKSLKPNHWKPSEEQLRAIINSAQGLYQCKEKEVLLDLYEQLKNL